MTLGEKLRQTRLQAGLSQAQLAQKLFVTRAAVAKWETGKGMPDIENLKAISKLLNVSIDYLLDDEATQPGILRQTICLDDYEVTGRCKNLYDAAVIARFPDAYWIVPASLQFDLNPAERIVNAITFGLFACIWQLCHWKQYTLGHYYLVELGDHQSLVQVEETSMTVTALNTRIRNVDAFDVGSKCFICMSRDLLGGADSESDNVF